MKENIQNFAELKKQTSVHRTLQPDLSALPRPDVSHVRQVDEHWQGSQPSPLHPPPPSDFPPSVIPSFARIGRLSQMVNGSLAKPFDKPNSSTDSKENRFPTRLNQLYVSLKMLDPKNGVFRLGSRYTNLKRGTYLKPSDLAPNCSTRKMGIFANAYKASCRIVPDHEIHMEKQPWAKPPSTRTQTNHERWISQCPPQHAPEGPRPPGPGTWPRLAKTLTGLFLPKRNGKTQRANC